MREKSSRKSSPDPADESRPYPPRFHWLKRLSLALLLLMLCVAGLRAWWGHVSQARVYALIAAAQARGEPILPEDFNLHEIPASDNAAILYAQAEQSLTLSQAEKDFWPSWPYSDTDIQFIQKMVLAHAPEIRTTRAARNRHGAAWGFHFSRSQQRFYSSRRFNEGRQLMVLMSYNTLFEHIAEDDVDAVWDAQAMLALADAHVNVEPSIMNLLVAEGMENACADTVMKIASSLVIAGTGKQNENAATPAQVRSLINDLLDESRFIRESQRDWMGERMLAIEAEGPTVNLEIHPALLADFLWPMFQLQSHRAATSYESAMNASRMENFQAASTSLPPREDTEGESQLVLTVQKDLFNITQHDTVVVIGYQVLATRRIAAIMLAMRLYQAEHAGRLPETLEELASAYFPKAPLDPFSPTNAPLRYLPHHDPPIVYSVGRNGTDEGGSTVTTRRHSTWVWDGQDAVFAYKAATATTQPGN